MAFDIFMKFDGIPGESTDDKHKDEIVLESFSWGESNAASRLASGGGAGAGKVSMQDFHFTAHVSKASPVLMLYCANGKHIKTGAMSVRRADVERAGTDFLIYKFTDVLVSSIQQGGNVNDLPLEEVSLNFTKIEIDYKEQKANGELGATVRFGWDLKTNKSF
jgi:type VI secretion system secreted protein Hcp